MPMISSQSKSFVSLSLSQQFKMCFFIRRLLQGAAPIVIHSASPEPIKVR